MLRFFLFCVAFAFCLAVLMFCCYFALLYALALLLCVLRVLRVYVACLRVALLDFLFSSFVLFGPRPNRTQGLNHIDNIVCILFNVSIIFIG